MGRLFGTDGARGVANVELTCELAMNIGRAAAIVLAEDGTQRPKFVIGKDTRISSDMIASSLIAGLCSVGADAVDLGVVPTPAVAYLVKNYNADAGIMISASHNPFEFNGIKLFNKAGYKLQDLLENEIESLVLDKIDLSEYFKSGSDLGRLSVAKNAISDYIDHIKSTVNVSLDGLNVAFDCSNGSASSTAKELFTELGANVFMLNDKPDGININDNCGSVHLDGLSKYVRENNMDLGIAFDGDADRCLAVDNKGNPIDGDFLMAICASYLKSMGKLSKNVVVGTVMTNMGFIKFCEKAKIGFVSTKVGDRYVLEEMLKNGYNFGGEQSGHIIFLDYSTTGDGQLTAAQLLSILKESGGTFSELTMLMNKYPQILVNVNVKREAKERFYTDNVVKSAIEKVQKYFSGMTDFSEEFTEVSEFNVSGSGRIVVRLSGTEPIVRVMLEGEDQDIIRKFAKEVGDVIKARLS